MGRDGAGLSLVEMAYGMVKIGVVSKEKDRKMRKNEGSGVGGRVWLFTGKKTTYRRKKYNDRNSMKKKKNEEAEEKIENIES